MNEFEARWNTAEGALRVIPGKGALKALNQHLQDRYGISITPTGIIDAMRRDEVPIEMVELIGNIAQFAASRPEPS